MKTTLLTIALIAGFALATQAEEKSDQPAQPAQHHAADQAAEKKPEGMMNHDMMNGKMDMTQMHAMMGDCMNMHKDAKMCDSQTMEQCQKNMGKMDCSKMMKKAKAHKGK